MEAELSYEKFVFYRKKEMENMRFLCVISAVTSLVIEISCVGTTARITSCSVHRSSFERYLCVKNFQFDLWMEFKVACEFVFSFWIVESMTIKEQWIFGLRITDNRILTITIITTHTTMKATRCECAVTVHVIRLVLQHWPDVRFFKRIVKQDGVPVYLVDFCN
jgi:hypothetical protein